MSVTVLHSAQTLHSITASTLLMLATDRFQQTLYWSIKHKNLKSALRYSWLPAAAST